MNLAEMETCLASMTDNQLLFHGYTRFMRDYELIVYVPAAPRSGIEPQHSRFLFRYCTEADIRSVVSPEVWSTSLDDHLLTRTTVERDEAGYVWGVQGQELYPGATVVRESARAKAWSEKTGIPFFEVQVRANAHELTLVFSNLTVEQVSAGYAPYVVGGAPAAEQYASGSKVPLAPPQPGG